MKLLISMVIAFVFLVSPASSVAAEELTAEKLSDIETLIDVTGALDLAEQLNELFAEKFSQDMKAKHPDLDPELLDALRDDIAGVIEENIPAMVALLVPLYHEHFTHTEIKGLITFYTSDVGKKVVKVTPLIARDSLLLGQRWALSLVPEIHRRFDERLRAEGVRSRVERPW